MSVLKDARNLVLGNGDLFLADTVAQLPALSDYKAAKAAGTLAALAGNVGAIKGTVTVQLIREMVAFEVGVPQETADQTVIREGVHLKCALAELDLVTVKKQLGGGNYSTTTAGPVQVVNESIVLSNSVAGEPIASSIAHAPILFTSSVPAAAADPVVKNAAGTTTYVLGTDYTIDDVNNTITRVASGSIPAGSAISLTYYYNQPLSETITGGGQAAVAQSALRFFHPYKDGRALQFTIYKANPVGTVTLPFEEIAYTNSELEFKGIADFSRAAGNHLYELLRETFA
jgi:hypothetical protein